MQSQGLDFRDFSWLFPPAVFSDLVAQGDVLKRGFHPSGFYLLTFESRRNNNNAPSSVQTGNTGLGVHVWWGMALGPLWHQGTEWQLAERLPGGSFISLTQLGGKGHF